MIPRDPHAARPRAVFCALDQHRRDLATAQAVCAGRFAIAGSELALGMPPDFRAARLPSDEEWEIEFQKFYYGLDLAHAFGETGEQRFLVAFETLVGAWLAQVPPDAFSADVVARRVQNWIYAWQRFAGAPAFPGLCAGLPERMVESLGAQLAFVSANLSPERNHRTLELYALVVAALALPNLDPSGEMLAHASGAIEENLLRDVLPDGVHREQSTHYHMTALRSFLGFRENARRFGLSVSEAFDARLLAACEFAAHIHRPDGEIPAFSDADGGSHLDLLALAAGIFAREDFAWIASAGRRGLPPAQTSTSFACGGYYVQRSGWGRERAFAAERQLVLDAGPLGDGGHGHYDALSFELYSGRPLLLDPGRFTYEEAEPNWRRWFKGTAAHNTITVDELDQTPYRRGKPRGEPAEAELLLRARAAGLDVLRGAVRSPAYPARHRRRVWFVASQYWIVEDLVESERVHELALWFHFAPSECEIEARRGEFAGEWQSPGLSLSVWPHCEAQLESGFVSRDYGVREPAPVLALRQRAAVASFVTLLSPRGPDDEPRRIAHVEVTQLGAGRTRGRLAIALGANGACDWLAWSDDGAPLAARDGEVFRGNSHVWLRVDAQGRQSEGAHWGTGGGKNWDAACGAWRPGGPEPQP